MNRDATTSRAATESVDPATADGGARWGTFDARGLGTLWLAWTSEGVSEVRFTRDGLSPGLGATPEAPVPSWLSDPLVRYFEGERVDFRLLPVHFVGGTEYQRRVWDELRRIPYGEVCTYQHVAQALGSPRGSRAVGMANGKNPVPIIVPCHRVVEMGHKLGGYTGGSMIKTVLLEREGAVVEGDLVRPGQLSLF